ncbi:hypothetical protein [Zophobihabitans entericus]|uniref:Uncharacterized protein n=1 Tax=Zophobihabitans entericus TaxID=1635327 RepID=A0A6G9ICD4_9GAMM|nr:hypothetical protein [Zophobihabitans entericus]QIQ21479.1 hypothetical protein IPMB12_07150 [Zophobihabitans entericus]
MKPLPPDKNGIVYSQIEVNGVNSLVLVDGTILEEAFCWQDRYILLFVINNLGFEELLFIYLFDTKINKIVDEARIGNLYAYDFVSDLQVISEDTIFFKFITKYGWILKLFDQPVRTFPFSFKHFFSIKRPFSSIRYFSVVPNNER